MLTFALIEWIIIRNRIISTYIPSISPKRHDYRTSKKHSRTIIRVSDKIISSGNLETRSEAATKRRMRVIDTYRTDGSELYVLSLTM